ncbi:MAG: DUF3306 domain-containing protein [Rhodanobacter sp.]
MIRDQEPQPDSITPEDEGFLSRWSRRKHEASVAQAPTGPDPPVVAAEAPTDAATAPTIPPATDGDAAAVVVAAPELPGDDDMPPLDTLGPESEVSAFFSPRVSEALRRAALHRIFHQPSFNVTDGLDDYSVDYRKLKPLGDVITSDMRMQMERVKERLLRSADVPGEPGSESHVLREPEVEASAESPVDVPELEAAAEDEELPDGTD